jgi:hypothetical protein
MRQPIQTDLNVNHYRFHRQLPHGALHTRKFSVRPRDPESSPWFSAAVGLVILIYLLACAMDYFGLVVGK